MTMFASHHRLHTSQVGKQRLLQSYFKLTQQPVDMAMLRELDKEDRELFAEKGEEEEEQKQG
ncbi:hypothetical protein EON63_11030 [archaeon]|nr:MAG: hypothetical protein EON63_11030 [archaeon]